MGTTSRFVCVLYWEPVPEMSASQWPITEIVYNKREREREIDLNIKRVTDCAYTYTDTYIRLRCCAALIACLCCGPKPIDSLKDDSGAVLSLQCLLCCM